MNSAVEGVAQPIAPTRFLSLNARHEARRHPDTVLIIDFGSQVTQLIARRVREAGVYSEIVPFQSAEEAFQRLQAEGA